MLYLVFSISSIDAVSIIACNAKVFVALIRFGEEEMAKFKSLIIDKRPEAKKKVGVL